MNRTLCDTADMLLESRGERALLLVWNDILELADYDDGTVMMMAR